MVQGRAGLWAPARSKETSAGDLVEGEREQSNEADSSWGSWSFSDALALQCRPRRQDVVPAERQCKVFSQRLEAVAILLVVTKAVREFCSLQKEEETWLLQIAQTLLLLLFHQS